MKCVYINIQTWVLNLQFPWNFLSILDSHVRKQMYDHGFHEIYAMQGSNLWVWSRKLWNHPYMSSKSNTLKNSYKTMQEMMFFNLIAQEIFLKPLESMKFMQEITWYNKNVMSSCHACRYSTMSWLSMTKYMQETKFLSWSQH